MKTQTIMKLILLLLPAGMLIAIPTATNAQVLKKLAKKAEKAAERTVERRIEKETEKNTDKVLDKVFEGDDTKDKKEDQNPRSSGNQTNDGQSIKGENHGETADSRSFASYGKFDFIPGEKVIAFEDFTQDALGDFPAKWNTNSSGEIKTIGGSDAKWLALTGKGVVTPEFITDLPENFTLEFDLAVTPGYSFYDAALWISMVNLSNPNGFTAWNMYGPGKKDGVVVTLHPQDAGNAPKGSSGYSLWENGTKTMDNSMGALTAFNASDRNIVKVSIWRQNQRLRFYIDETKIWDLPRAFAKNIDYNTLVFARDGATEGNHYFISNLRLAVGAPDTRSKLITEGKFSTTGIYFNTGSAVIKPESYGVLKEIATVLNENGDVNVVIIGHTDGDGSDESNLKLSKERAEAVKGKLNTEFGIGKDRMLTDGKGEGEPVGDNATPEGKAQNRRVEFIKK